MKDAKDSLSAIDKAVEAKGDTFDAIAQQKTLMQSLMIRRQEDSRGWHGEPLRDIGISYIYNVEVTGEWDPQLLEHVKAVFEKQRGANSNEAESSTVDKHALLKTGRIARIVACVPWIAGYIDENPDFRATQDEILKNEWAETLEDSPFYDAWEAILGSSPKLQEIVNIRRSQTTDIKNKKEKLVIFSEFPIVVFITKIVLDRVFPDEVIEAVWGKTSHGDRSTFVERFNTGFYAKGEKMVRGDLDILVFTSQTGAHGHNLAQRCFRSVQFEPWTSASKEDQARARTWRGGQLNPLCEYYMLRDTRFKVEEVVMNLRDGRQAVAKEMYGVRE